MTIGPGACNCCIKPSDTFSALLNVHGRSLNGSSTVFRANIMEPGSNKLIPGFNPNRSTTPMGRTARPWGRSASTVHLAWTLAGVTLQSISGYETVQKYLALGDIDGGYGPGNVFCQPNCTVPTGPGSIPFAVETSAGLLHHEQLTQEFRVLTNYDGSASGAGRRLPVLRECGRRGRRLLHSGRHDQQLSQCAAVVVPGYDRVPAEKRCRGDFRFGGLQTRRCVQSDGRRALDGGSQGVRDPLRQYRSTTYRAAC